MKTKKITTPMLPAVLVSAGLAAVGCANTTDVANEPVEANALGITQLQVEHTYVHNDRLMTIRGLDEAGTEVASAALRTGMVLYGADTTPGWNPGTELTIKAGGDEVPYVSPDREPHDDFEPIWSPALTSFVRLHGVAAEIQAEARIGFKAAGPAGDEVAFSAAVNCDGSRFPTNKGNSTNCCQYYQETGHRLNGACVGGSHPGAGCTTNADCTGGTCNTSTHPLAIRGGWNSYAPPCLTSSGQPTCSGSACNFGACGMVVVYTPSGNDAKLFHQRNGEDVCGYDDNGTLPGGSHGDEEYDGTQTLFPGVTATCVSTTCVTGGHAANVLTGNIPAHGTGKYGAYGELTSSVGGLDILNYSGAATGTANVTTNGTTTLSACPDSQYATASISGACTHSPGAAGQCVTCNVTMSATPPATADKSVTATFGCTVEFGC